MILVSSENSCIETLKKQLDQSRLWLDSNSYVENQDEN